MSNEKFKSKVDTWLLAILVGAAGSAVFAALLTIQARTSATPLALLIVILAVALPIWVLASTYYVLTDSTLIVRSGPFHWQVPFASIHAVVPTRSTLSSPALSLDRLRIEYGSGRAILISPDDKASFLQALGSRKRAVSSHHAAPPHRSHGC